MTHTDTVAESVAPQPLPPFARVPVAVVGGVLALVLTALSWRYGYHRDELYFLVAGDHLAWGYVDQPPLTPLLAHLSTAVFGDTPAGLRVVATAAGVGMVVLAALIARELGGRRGAQVLAAVATAVSGFVAAVAHMVSTSTFDLLFWLALLWIAVRLLRTGDGRWWLAAGAVAGVALLNKDLVVLLAAAVGVALVAVGPRRVLRSPYLPVGAVVAVLIALPNLWWQAGHGWPQWTVAGGISADDGAENRVMFLPLQVLYVAPVLVPVWVAGWRRLWRDRAYRAVALAYPVLCVLTIAVGGKAYYAIPLLLVLLVAGCEPTLRWVERSRPARRRVLAAALVFTGLTSAVISLPVLPASMVNIAAAANPEQAEQIGWPELAGAVAEAYATLPHADRATAVVFAQNYGQAGALIRYGPGLPVYSGHMSFADWGPPPDSATGPVILVRQDGGGPVDAFFTGCADVARVDNGEGVENEEQNAVVSVCAGPARPWSRLWPELRRFY